MRDNHLRTTLSAYSRVIYIYISISLMCSTLSVRILIPELSRSGSSVSDGVLHMGGSIVSINSRRKYTEIRRRRIHREEKGEGNQVRV